MVEAIIDFGATEEIGEGTYEGGIGIIRTLATTALNISSYPL
jgi:hypothetical protein